MAMSVIIIFELTAKVYLADLRELAIVSSELVILQKVKERVESTDLVPICSMNH
jgi:hypothetical protein